MIELASLTPATAALLGALIGGFASVLGIFFTHWFTSHREQAKEGRTTLALLAFIRGEVDALGGLCVHRRDALTDIEAHQAILRGKDVAQLELAPLRVTDQDAAVLGLLPLKVVTDLFSLNATIVEINRLASIWSSKYPEDILSAADTAEIKKMFLRLLDEVNSLNGLVAVKLLSPVGKVLLVLGNLIRALKKRKASDPEPANSSQQLPPKNVAPPIQLASKMISAAAPNWAPKQGW